MDFNKENINDPISISLKEEYETYNLLEYIACSNPLRSRIDTDKRSENALIRDYSGRELYEIIQNADDQYATTIEIELDNSHRLHIRNNGGRPFSNKGLLSVMRPHQSWKRDEPKSEKGPIGNKGLGIRSLLNWSDGMTIHSNGVEIAFSSTIARKKWEHIITQTPTLIELEKENKCPLAILSVPEVTKDNITSDMSLGMWTTEIEISCHLNVITDIKSKMEALHSEVLLFLKHIRNVILIIDGKETKLSRRDEKNLIEDSMPFFTLLTEGSAVYRYAVFQEMIRLSDKSPVEKGCMVSVAYATDAERYCNYLYSYFPTEIPLRLPCVVHADFELTMSRNALTRCNQNAILMKQAAFILIKAAEYRAKEMIRKDFGLNRLLPLKMLSPDEASCQMLPDFSVSIEKSFDSCRIIPTIDGKFKAITEHIYYHPLVDINRFSSKFKKDSLLNNYISEKTNEAVKKKNKTPENLVSLHGQLSELAFDLEIEELSDLIVELLKVREWDKRQRPSVLRLDTTQMADAEERVFVLESKDVTAVLKDVGVYETVAPRELKLKILHPALSKALQKSLKTDSRGLTRTLKEISEVQDADFSRVKEEIEKQSKTMSESDLNGVIRWLYNRWTRRGKATGIMGDKDSAPLCGVFQLFNANGYKKPVCSLLLNSEDKRFLINESHLGVVPEADRVMFFIEYLGCAEALPLEPFDFSKDESYLNIVMSEEKRTYVHKNIALIPAKEFINEKQKEIILALIIKDKRFFKSLREGTEISYVYYTDRTFRASLSYAAYWLTWDNGKLAEIKNYVVPASDLFDPLILNAGIINYNELKDVDKEELDNLLVLLGAKTNPLKLTFAQLYKILEQHNNPSNANKVYKEIRALMLRKEREMHEEATSEEKDILKTVWAIGPCERKERRPKQEVFYWDNSRLPKKFLSSLWKLCLGARTGEQSVHRLFGVNLLSDLNLRIVSW